MTSLSRRVLAAANGEGHLTRNAPPNKDDVLGISEMLDHQPKNDNGHDHGPERGEDPYQSAYDAGLASAREAGYRQGYREGFSDGYKFRLRNPLQETTATPDKSTVESKKTAAKTVTRLRGLPCANCGHSTYSDELECPSCGTPKAHAVSESLQE